MNDDLDQKEIDIILNKEFPLELLPPLKERLNGRWREEKKKTFFAGVDEIHREYEKIGSKALVKEFPKKFQNARPPFREFDELFAEKVAGWRWEHADRHKEIRKWWNPGKEEWDLLPHFRKNISAILRIVKIYQKKQFKIDISFRKTNDVLCVIEPGDKNFIKSTVSAPDFNLAVMGALLESSGVKEKDIIDSLNHQYDPYTKEWGK